MAKPIVLGIIGVIIAFVVNYVYSTSSDDDIFFRLSVTVLAGMYAGLLFLIFVLPAISDGISRLMFSDPGGKPDEEDPMREARALQAQGDYVGALESLRQVVMDEPDNRLAWAEMAKIQITQLDDAEGALNTLSEALEGREWEVDDAAFFMFRISEVQLENMQNKDAAITILQQVCSTFPETRHSANATHQLRELGAL
ncbi:tetratricopeptide repeat protein [Rubritalea tangerina]|uniref:Tol-pal system YbgF family protein n=1 Tax=Rubritalea tangerina TaxID=430798 RepID=A0ABW4ZBB5_9BACT